MEDNKMSESLSLTLHVEAGTDVDAEEMAELSRQLRQELLELSEVEHADFDEKPAPEGTMTGGAVDWMQIILALLASGGVLVTTVTALGGVIQAWINRQKEPKPGITVEFPNGAKITLTGASEAEVQKLTAQAMDYQRGFTPRN
jgi:hypothetical protein